MNIKKIFKNREFRLKILNACPLPDKVMLKILFRLSMKDKLNLKNPVTFNEKLQWLKLYDRNPFYSDLVDKYKVRNIIENSIGENYLIPLLGKWDRYEDIDFNLLPNSFVLKCNHDSGSIKIINDKSTIDHKELKKFYKSRLKNNPYRYGREWPYKSVKPCIIAEKFMGENNQLPTDYKFFCFDGYVDSVMICTSRGTDAKRFYFFDQNWTLKKYNKSSQDLPDNYQLPKPEQMDELFKLASHMSQGFKFIRLDFYIISGQIYFGEYTFFPASGFDPNLLPEVDKYFGSLIDLKLVK